jgi:hypothetical protein
VGCSFAINPFSIDEVFVNLAKGSAIALVQHYQLYLFKPEDF